MLPRLADLRKSRNWSMQEIADRLGIAKSTYAGYESGYREPSLQAITQIADLFGTTVDYILNRKNSHLPTTELTELLTSTERPFTIDEIPLSTDEIIEFIAFIRAKRNITS